MANRTKNFFYSPPSPLTPIGLQPWFSCSVKSGEAPKESLSEDEKEAKSRGHSMVQKPSEEDEEGERKVEMESNK